MADKSGPCPKIDKPQETEKQDNRLAKVTEADFTAEESKEESA